MKKIIVKKLYKTEKGITQFCQQGTPTRLVKLMGELQKTYPDVKYQIR